MLVNKEGSISDVPWKNFVHNRWSVVDDKDNKNNKNNKNCQSDQLYFIDGGAQSSRQTVATIKCETCDTSREFTSDERGAMFFLGQPWAWTWIGSEQRKEIKAESGQPEGMVVAINDSRVYYPDTRRLLVIPPESRLRQGTVVDQLYRNSKEREEYEKSPPGRLRDGVIKRLGSKFHCSKEEVISAFEELERGYPLYGETFSTGITMEAEYDALLENYTDQREDEDFVVEHCSTRWHELSAQFADQPILHTILHHVNHLVKVKRLKVIHVFKGFSRGEVEENSPPVSPTLYEEVDWYPAMELYGEGIFLTLEEKTLATWEKQVEKTVCFQAMLKRYEQFGIQVSQGDEPSPLIPRHILLHTLSHLLIRQFETQCGYPAASLSERIYSDNSNKLMAGILIYTAVPDIAGSLGGLVELSEPTTFLNILSKAIEHAQWCSLDPICCEHEAHGPALLNYAACHACTLLPETSCDFNNNLLDRNFIIGHAGKHLPPFFDTTSKDK